MERGAGGLTESIGLFMTRPNSSINVAIQPKWNSNHHDLMDSINLFSGFGNYVENHDKKRLDELDFFSLKNTQVQEFDDVKALNLCNIKKEDSLNENLDVNVSNPCWVLVVLSIYMFFFFWFLIDLFIFMVADGSEPSYSEHRQRSVYGR